MERFSGTRLNIGSWILDFGILKEYLELELRDINVEMEVRLQCGGITYGAYEERRIWRRRRGASRGAAVGWRKPGGRVQCQESKEECFKACL